MSESYMDYNPNDYNSALFKSDMLEGCINRIFVSDSDEEVDRMFICAVIYITDIYKYGLSRIAFENKKSGDENEKREEK